MRIDPYTAFAIFAVLMMVNGYLYLRLLSERDHGHDENSRLSDTQFGQDDAQLQAIFDASPFPILVVDVANEYRAVVANQAWYTDFMIDGIGTLGKTPTQIDIWVEPDDRMELFNQLTSVAKQGTVEARLRRGDGKVMWWRVAANRVNVSGRNLMIYSGQNIDEQREFEQSLKESNELFNKIFDMIPEGLVVTDAKGIYHKVNQTWLDKTGYTRDQILGHTSTEIGLWPYPEERLALRDKFLGTGEINGERIRVRMADGRILLGDIFGKAAIHRGEWVQLWLTKDVTDQEMIADRLRQKQVQLELIFNLLPEPLLVTDANQGRILDVNPAWERLFGLSRQTALGRTTLEVGLYSPEDVHTRRELHEMLELDGSVDLREMRFRRTDGTPLMLEVSARKVQHEGTSSYFFTLRDVTEARRMLRALKDSERSLAETFRLMPEALLITDAADGRIVDMNPAFEATFGRSREDMLGKTTGEIPLYKDGEGMRSIVRERMRQFGRIDAMEVTFRRADGAEFASIISGNTQRTHGRITYIFVVRDVSENRRMIRELQESRSFLGQMFDVVPEAIAVNDTDTGQMIDLNRFWVEKLGTPKEVALGQTIADLGVWPDRDSFGDLRRKYLRQGQLDAHPTNMRRTDGTVIHTEISARKFLSGSKNLTIWVARDITEQRLAETALNDINATLEQRVAHRTQELSDALEFVHRAQAELVRSERLSSLGSLVAGVAHELNTPLGNAMMAASTLNDDSEKMQADIENGLTRSRLSGYIDSVSTGVQILMRSVKRAADLVSSFKQISVDQASHQRREFELDETMREVLLILSPMLGAIDVTLDVPKGLKMNSYPGAITQVMMNLVNNAAIHGFIRKTSDRAIHIHVRQDDEAMVAIAVTDNGDGMPSENLAKVFDPFFTTRLGQGGSGLGLHICFNLVVGLLGGKIDVASELQSGTTFTLRLPLVTPISK